MPRYRDRLQVRPGLTGLAQVQLPPDTDLESVRKKLACDLFYIERMGLWLDVRLMIATGLYLVAGSYRLACRLLRIPGGQPVKENYERLAVQQYPPSPSRITTVTTE